MNRLHMRKNQTKGKLITFCGLDGCGKTTIIRRLMEELEGAHQVFLTRQPTDFVRQSAIFRTYMDSPNHDAFDYRSLSLLAASDRVQHGKKVIEPAMEQGQIVLSDRYFYSCLANLRARGFESDQWIYEIAESVIEPDIAFFFDLPVAEAISRVRSRPAEKDRYIDIALQHRLRKEYRDICRANDGVLISTVLTLDESYALVKQKIREVALKDGC
ncbi:MAG: dTMP kinase [Clostridia bacterium]